MKPTEIIGNCHLYLGDCREVLPHLPKVDLVLTDPPYGIDYNPKRSQKSSSSGSRKELIKVYGDSIEFDPSFIFPLSDKYVFFGANNYAKFLPSSNGWIFWDKRDGGTVFPGFIGSDGEMAWTNCFGRVRVFAHRWCGHLRDSERTLFVHPTQKPVALMEWCLDLAPKTTLTVADPFMGSGTTGVACANMGKTFYGIEREEKYFDIACKRIEAAYAQGRLFA